MAKNISHRSSAGFTLVEIVIAIGLLVVVLGIVYSTLTQIIESKRLLDDRRDGTAIASAVLGRMTRELQLAYSQSALLPPPDDLQKRYPARVSLIGEEKTIEDGVRGDSITFLALEGGQYLPDGGSHSGLVQITYRVEKDPEGDSKKGTYYLVRQETPYIRPPENAYKKTMIFPITNSLVELKFSYYVQDSQEWVESWDESRDKLPSVVRFTVGIKTPLGKTESYTTSVVLRSKQTN